MLRKIVYSKMFFYINKSILSLFYEKKYLSGKFFEDQRYGFVWAWKGIFRRIKYNKHHISWPIGQNVNLPNGENIIFDSSSLNIFQSNGCYFQNHFAKIYIGKNVYIAPNVGLITANHDPVNLDKHLEGKPIKIGNHCWIGMNSVILPGITLGENTIVGAGSIVTKSFPEGNCIIVGNPARQIKKILKETTND